jgi:integrase
MPQQGHLIRLKRRGREGEPLWAYRYRMAGRGSKRVQRGGFASDRDAAEALERERELERLRRERRLVVWGMIDANPAKLGVDNPSPRRREQRPFDSWGELDAVAAYLSPRYRPMVIFAAAMGLRPAEWLALEWRDIDLEARVVYVHRSFTKGRLKCPKTEASCRAVPMQTIALDAIGQQPSSRRSALVFPAQRGGYLTCTTSETENGSRRSSRLGSSPCAGSTISDTPSPPSRCVPAFPPS